MTDKTKTPRKNSAKLALDRFLPFRLSIASNQVSDTVATAYESIFRLRVPEWRLIAVIAEAGAISQFEIGRRTRMDKVTVSRAAIALFDRGLIERTANPNDQRSHLLALSADGRALYASVAPKALKLETQIFGDFSAQEIKDFLSVLERIERAAAQVAQLENGK